MVSLSFLSLLSLLLLATTRSAHGEVGGASEACSLSQAAAAGPQLLHEDEAVARLDALAAVSDYPLSLERTFFSPAHLRAGELLRGWMEDAGLRAWTDVVGNVRGRADCKGECESCGGALVFGSHYDTVRDAGKFDGALGIVVALAAVKAHLSRGPPRCPVEVVAFSEEEGVRFHSTFLGSRVFAGALPESALQARDGNGTSLEEALLARSSLSGGAALRAALLEAAAPRGSVRAYVEAHIEQGPVLERLGLPLGAVSAIAGQTFLAVSVSGEQGHAGTVPMAVRRDSLAAAAEAVLAVERLCKAHEGGSDEGLVCTVGALSVWPGASNVIAGQTNFSVDLRSRRDETRLAVVAAVRQSIQAVCDARGVPCSISLKHQAGALECSPALRSSLEAAAQAVSGQPAPVLVSGAGHDAMALAGLCEVGMLFVRCRGGVSHSPLEHVQPDDVRAAVRVLLHMLQQDGGPNR